MARRPKPVINGKKQCSACKEWKALEEFGVTPRQLSGRRSRCMQCDKLIDRYGITAEQYAAILEAQGGKCAICRKPPEEYKTGRGRGHVGESGTSTQFHVDHDHFTGQVRGLLCSNCNHGLGNFKDSTELLLAALAYLEYNVAHTGVKVKERGLWSV